MWNMSAHHLLCFHLQAAFPNLPVAVALVLEMHLSVAAKHDDVSAVNLIPLGQLFADAGHGWCANAGAMPLHHNCKCTAPEEAYTMSQGVFLFCVHACALPGCTHILCTLAF